MAQRGRRRRSSAGGDETDRRTEIVEAAARVLAREGFENTSLKQIAEEAGIATALIHYYFRNKEELLIAVVQYLDSFFHSAWRSRIGEVSDPLERMMASVESIAVMMRNHPEHWRLQFQLYMLSQSNPNLRPATSEMVKGLLEKNPKLRATQVATRSSVDPGGAPAAVPQLTREQLTAMHKAGDIAGIEDARKKGQLDNLLHGRG